MFCSGENPSSVLGLPPFARGYIDLVSVAIHLFVFVRIKIFKNRDKQSIGPQTRSCFLRGLTLADLEMGSLSSFTTNICAVLLLALGVVNVYFSNFKTAEDFKKYPRYLMVYYSYLLFPSGVCFCLVFVYYAKNKQLTREVLRELNHLSLANN